MPHCQPLVREIHLRKPLGGVGGLGKKLLTVTCALRNTLGLGENV
jgi:hypothetical protein